MKPDRLISVVLCTHNGERFLPEQLASLARQTVQPAEYVISDDASTDGTRDLVDRFRQASPVPVEVIHNDPGLGYKDNFLGAALAAKSPWIAFCDQDDVWRADKLERCTAVLAPEVTMVAHTADLIDAAGAVVGHYDQDIHADAIRPPLHYDVWKTFSGFSMVVRREMFEVAPPELRYAPHEEPGEAVLAHDRWAFFLAQTMGHTVEIAAPLVAYRQHDTNVYGTAPRGVWQRMRPRPRGEVRQGQQRLVDESQAMLDVVATLPASAIASFPAFDRDAALTRYADVLARTRARVAVYDAGRATGLRRVIRGAVDDVYRTRNGGRQNWQSVLKDLSYCTLSRE